MRTPEPIRNLSISELGVDLPADPTSTSSAEDDAEWLYSQGIAKAEAEEELRDDPVFQEVNQAIEDGYAGVILSGPPGTSKSWYAVRIAQVLAESGDRVRLLQFHPSFQYEDFVQGWVANGTGGFILQDKHFLQVCQSAAADNNHKYFLVIDEISRCDVSRVFGEALTYLETTKRGVRFKLASGSEAVVPRNVFILATMNPWDVTVDELDFALQRRFAFVEMRPNADLLEQLLAEKNVAPDLIDRVIRFFRMVQGRANPMLHIGHAYFNRVTDKSSLQRLWLYQLRPHFLKVTRLEHSEFQAIEASWREIVEREPEPVPDAAPASAAEQSSSPQSSAGQ